jgi:thioredoxin-related protein
MCRAPTRKTIEVMPTHITRILMFAVLMTAGVVLIGCSESSSPKVKPKPKPPTPELAPKRPKDTLSRGAELGKWTHDLAAAQKLAQEKKLPIMLKFTGSDWCPPCKAMEERIFATAVWKDYAIANLVMVIIDYPTDEELVPRDFRARNDALQRDWRITGYPTFVITDATGEKEFGRLQADRKLMPDAFVTNVKNIITGKKAFRAQPIQLGPVEIVNRVGKGKPVIVLSSGAKLGQWTEDIAAAVQLATEKKLPLLFNFTGSDWCQPCASMKERVFERASWQRHSKDRYVLVTVDFPQHKKIAPERKERNEKLAKKFMIEAFPSFLLFELDGRTLVGQIPAAVTPHEFRRNITEVSSFLNTRIEKVARKIGDPDGAAYKKLMLNLRSQAAEHRKQMMKAAALRQIGGLTPEFVEKLNTLTKDIDSMATKAKSFENKLFTRKLDAAMAKKYLSMQGSLHEASENYRSWLENPPRDPDEFAQKRGEHQEAITTIRTAIQEIEDAVFIKTLKPAEGTDFKKMQEELERAERSFNSWLNTNPARTPENEQKYQQHMERIEKLRDELDAIRDGV